MYMFYQNLNFFYAKVYLPCILHILCITSLSTLLTLQIYNSNCIYIVFLLLYIYNMLYLYMYEIIAQIFTLHCMCIDPRPN